MKSRALSLALVSLVTALSPAALPPVAAQSCPACTFDDCHTPANPAPSSFGGELLPADDSVYPIARDSSHRSTFGSLEGNPRWLSVDVTDVGGKWAFTALSFRLQIWNLASSPGDPSMVSDLAFSQSGLQGGFNGHTPRIFESVRLAPQSDDLLAVAASNNVGISFFDTSDKSAPRLLYQDSGTFGVSKSALEVYTARQGNRDYAFTVGSLQGTGLRIYDMTRAAGFATACYEMQPTTSCSGVHVGSISTYTRALGIDGAGNFIAVATNPVGAQGGVYIYDISSPSSPAQRMHMLSGQAIVDVAMWNEGAKYYVAVRTSNQGRIYDVSCIVGGSCSNAILLSTTSLTSSNNGRVTFSRSGSTPMLYWTAGESCGSGAREELQDVSDPAAPRALAPAAYWEYYHWASPTGFNYVRPSEGMFLDQYFYRTAFSIFDAHVWQGGQVSPDPPTVGSVSATPNPALQCQPVTFTANNVTNGIGATYEWEVRSGGLTMDSDSGSGLNPYVWDTTGFAAGQYVGRVVVTQPGVGSSTPAQSPAVTLNALPALPAPGFAAPTVVTNNFGAVTFSTNASGATEWSWDFGEGAGFEAWTNDPVEGPNPTHVFGSLGTFSVKVRVRNCQAGPVESASTQVNITELDPLVASFAFQTCPPFGPPCSAGQEFWFSTAGTSGADTYSVDWNGDGGFEDGPFSAPVPSVLKHTYNSSGTFNPVLRVARAGANATDSATVQVGGSTPPPPPPPPPPPSGPSVSISGPTSGQVGLGYSFTAFASNCSPAANGWTWTHNGEASPTTSNSISITWNTAGSKSISASNSACGSATDSHFINIGSGSGQVTAAFTFSVSGQTVSFNANSSQGSPSSYLWEFGDGQDGSGAVVQHTYAGAGSFTVRLSVSRHDPSCTPFGLCESSTTKIVTVGGAPPPPPPPPPPSGGLCVPDGDTFCALGDFEIEVDWKKKNGETGVGQIVNGATSGNTGVFYFFDGANWELLLKVLDGCAINDHYWVFGGAATNVEYQIRVTDLVTEDVWTYDNPQGKSSDAITDVLAFPTCNVDRAHLRSLRRTSGELSPRVNPTDPTLNPDAPAPPPPPPPPPPANVGPCDPDANTLCAISERFRVRVDWETKKGETGSGTVMPMVTDNTGVFWFFHQDNWELLVKVLNGCGINGRYWVFGAGATDVRYVVTVEDLSTGAEWQYENILGQASPAITDTLAFDTCP